MADFVAIYYGALEESRRPEGFPRVVKTIGTYQAESVEELRAKVNVDFSSIIQNQGMIIQVDPSKTIDPSKVNVEGRMFVPMHMLSRVWVDVQPMTTMPRPTISDIVDKDGKEITGFELPTREGGKKVLPS